MLLDVLNWAIIGILGCVGLCLLAMIVPFRPFGSRRRAAWSLLVAAGALLATNFSLAAVAPPAPARGPAAVQHDVAGGAPEAADKAPVSAAAEVPAEGDRDATRIAPDEALPPVAVVQAPAPPVAEPPPAPQPVAAPATGPGPGAAALGEMLRGVVPRRPLSREAGARFPESAFGWTRETRPHSAEIVEIVNRIARQHAACPDPDPASVTRSPHGTPEDPQFLVTCGRGHEAFRLRFRPGDAASGRVFAAAPPLEPAAALAACESAARGRAAQPETVQFADAPALTHVNARSGIAQIQTTFTARDAGNRERGHAIECLFEGSRLIEARVWDRAG